MYNPGNLLRDLEVHHCDQVRINDVAFNDDLDEVAEKLKTYSLNWKKNDGEYFFEELKMVLSNYEQMVEKEMRLHISIALQTSHVLQKTNKFIYALVHIITCLLFVYGLLQL